MTVPAVHLLAQDDEQARNSGKNYQSLGWIAVLILVRDGVKLTSPSHGDDRRAGLYVPNPAACLSEHLKTGNSGQQQFPPDAQ